MRTILVVAVSLAVLLKSHAAVYFWDADANASSTLGGSGDWNTSSSLWHLGSVTGPLLPWPEDRSDITAQLGGISGTLTLTTNISLTNIFAVPISGSVYTIRGTAGALNLQGPTPSTINVATNTTLAITTRLSSTSGFTKTGSGTLIIDNSANDVTGGILLNEGKLQIGSTANNSASAALSLTSIQLASGTTLSVAGTGMPLRIGSLTGKGTVDVADKPVHLQALGPANPLLPGNTFTRFGSGTVFSGTIKAGGFSLAGMNSSGIQIPGGTTVSMQTLDGNTIGITGPLTINSGAGLTLTGRENTSTGSGTTETGVTTASRVDLRGGALILDNSNGNTSASGGRIPNTTSVFFASGSLVLVGSSLGTSEGLGTASFDAGANTVTVVQTSPTGGTTLTFSTVNRSTTTARSTMDFRGEGGVIGSGTTSPRITMGSSGASALGPWTTVNGDDYSRYDSTHGVVAASYTALTGVIATDGTSSQYYQITGSAEKSGSNVFSARGLQLKPTTSGQTVSITGSGDLNIGGILLAGGHDSMISASGTGGLSSTSPIYLGIADANTTLMVASSFKSPGSDIVKFGNGFLHLTGDNTGTLNTGTTAFVLNSGTLRVSLGTNAASLPTNGRTSVVFRGGVLEIANGGEFQFNLGIGTGAVNWANSDSDRGDGGFSAINSNAVVKIGDAASLTPLVWNDTHFVRAGNALTFGSTKADRRVTLLNNLNLNDAAGGNAYAAREIRVFDNPNVSSDATRLSGAISGDANVDLLKTGAGTLQLTGSNTFSGNTIVQAGTLQLGASDGIGAGASGALGGTRKILVHGKLTPVESSSELEVSERSTLLLDGDPLVTNRIHDAAQIVLDGGIFNTSGRSETVGTLTLLHADSILNLGTIAPGLETDIIRFAESSLQTWTGKLQIWFWNGNSIGGGMDQVYFGSTSTGLRTDQLPLISFYSDDGRTFLGTAGILADGEVVPIPEPSCSLLGAALLLGFRRWRRYKAAS